MIQGCGVRWQRLLFDRRACFLTTRFFWGMIEKRRSGLLRDAVSARSRKSIHSLILTLDPLAAEEILYGLQNC